MKPTMRHITTVAFDFIGMLTSLTGKQGWVEESGPATRCGLDYFYRSDKDEAWINVDQGDILVQLNWETLYEGSMNDNALRKFVTVD